MENTFDIYPPVTLEKYPFLKENKYFEYVINLTPLQIKKFGENNIITLDFTSNKEPFRVFVTNTQIKKVEVAKKLKRKVDLKFSKTQFKKTLPYVTKLNRSVERQRDKDQLETLKSENAKKARKLKTLKLRDELETLKSENAKKAKTLNKIKQEEEIMIDKFIKNTLKKYNKNKPNTKPKKSIWDDIKLPKANII